MVLVKDDIFRKLEPMTMAAARAHGFGAIMAQKGLHTDCCSVVTIQHSESNGQL